MPDLLKHFVEKYSLHESALQIILFSEKDKQKLDDKFAKAIIKKYELIINFLIQLPDWST